MVAPPPVAAWRHAGAREGFEVLFVRRDGGGWMLEGAATAAEDDDAWTVSYTVLVDKAWTTRGAHVRGLSALGRFSTRVETDGTGAWSIDGVPAPQLDGCLDVDLEASACTNALPIRRVALAVGASADAPAAYVRARDGRVERLEQRYTRLADESGRQRYDYTAPAFGVQTVLTFDAGGLVLDYPGLAVRAL
jgi:uncharacterized protein